jgi:hypothetical protein
MMSRLLSVLVTMLILLPATATLAEWPPMFWEETTTATMTLPAGSLPVLYNRPDGSGSMFSQARVTGGGVVDATITLNLNVHGTPIVGVPATDIWLEVTQGSPNTFVACAGGTIADGPTGPDGITVWRRPLRAGGWTADKTLVTVWGIPLASNTGLLLRHNSADINGDGTVTLVDVPLFVADFMSGQHPLRSDLQYDGYVNLSDMPRLMSAFGSDCP